MCLSLMRILVQQKESGLYFREIGAWSRDSRDARDFLSSTSAIDFCLANHIPGVHLVLKFEEQPYEIVLPVLPTSEHPVRNRARSTAS